MSSISVSEQRFALLGKRIPEERGDSVAWGESLDEIVVEIKELSGRKI